MLSTKPEKAYWALTMAYTKSSAKGGKSGIIMSRQIKYLGLKVGLLSSLLIACPLVVYANEDSGQSIIVDSPDNPGQIVKLRPFKPNRILPSRAELKALQEEKAEMAELKALQKETAQMAGQAQSQAVLNGQVSAFTNNSADDSYVWTPTDGLLHHGKHIAKTYQTALAHKTVINSINASVIAPVETGRESKPDFSFLRAAEQDLSSLFIHPAEPPNQQFGDTFSSNAMPSLPAPVEQMPAMPFSPSAGPSAFASAQTDNSGFGAAGPPPFPLSLLPQPILKQLVRSLAHSTATRSGSIPMCFGAWHNSSTFGTNTPIYANGSPQGSFQNYSPLAYVHRNTRPVGAPSAVTTLHRHGYARKNPIRYNQTKLFSYPAYPTQNIPGFNLAGN